MRGFDFGCDYIVGCNRGGTPPSLVLQRLSAADHEKYGEEGEVGPTLSQP